MWEIQKPFDKSKKVQYASVKIMRSYDYNHFEVCLGVEDATLEQVDELRKDAQRLVDKAVEQYRLAREIAVKRCTLELEREKLEKEVEEIKRIPPSERTAEQRAKIKALEDDKYWRRYCYNYEDDYEDDYDEEYEETNDSNRESGPF